MFCINNGLNNDSCVTHSDEPTENYHHLSSPQSFLSLFWLTHAILWLLCFWLKTAAIFSEKAL